jgi:hypothetical protein
MFTKATWALNAAKLCPTRKSRCVNQNAFELPAVADQGVNLGTQTLEISSLQRLLRLDDYYPAIWQDFELEHDPLLL